MVETKSENKKEEELEVATAQVTEELKVEIKEQPIVVAEEEKAREEETLDLQVLVETLIYKHREYNRTYATREEEEEEEEQQRGGKEMEPSGSPPGARWPA